MNTSPAFSWHHLNVWHIGVIPLFLLVAAGALYLYGAALARHWPRGRVACFLSGLVVTFLATQTFLGVYDMTYFSDHMVQHLLLIMVAASLFAFAAPLDLAYESGGERVRRWLDGRVMTRVTHPLFAFALYFAFIPATHLTGLFNLMMEHEWIHHTEQISFLVVGYLFFRGAFGVERGVTLHPGLRLVYVMAAVPVDTFTGLALSMSSRVMFPASLAMAPAGSTKTSVLMNLRLGGDIMWIGGDALMMLAMIPICVIWLRWEAVQTLKLDALLDAQGI